MKRILIILFLLAATTTWAVTLTPKTDSDVTNEKGKFAQDIAALESIQAAKLDTVAKLSSAVKQLAEIQERKAKIQKKLIGN